MGRVEIPECLIATFVCLRKIRGCKRFPRCGGNYNPRCVNPCLDPIIVIHIEFSWIPRFKANFLRFNSLIYYCSVLFYFILFFTLLTLGRKINKDRFNNSRIAFVDDAQNNRKMSARFDAQMAGSECNVASSKLDRWYFTRLPCIFPSSRVPFLSPSRGK